MHTDARTYFHTYTRILACIRTTPLFGLLTVRPNVVVCALQVHHERRRTYYLRPLKREELRADPFAEKALWIQAINTAISGIGHPFASKFRTRK